MPTGRRPPAWASPSSFGVLSSLGVSTGRAGPAAVRALGRATAGGGATALAPARARPGTDGSVHLKDLRGRVVVLYFYPRDNTPGCTTEACDFRDAYAGLNDAGVTVLGVSTDSLQSHQKFRAKHQLPFPLLSDEDASVAHAYGVYKEKNMYGKKAWGIERSTFIIDADGVVRKVYRKVRVPGHVADVAEQVQRVRL